MTKESGQKWYRAEILIKELTLLGSSQDSENGNSGYSYGDSFSRANASSFGQSRPATGEEHAYVDQGITDDDIPF